MEHSEQLDQIAAALAKAQGDMRFAAKGNVNPHFKSKYADLASVIEAIREPLSKNGIAHTTGVKVDDCNVTATVRLIHASGQWIAAGMTIKVPKADAMGIGSALTYARRYLLSAVCGIAADEDDDGAAAAGLPPHAAPAQRYEAPRHIEPVSDPIEDTRPYIERLRAATTGKDLLSIGKDFRKKYDKGTPQMDVFMPQFRTEQARIDAVTADTGGEG